MIYTHVAAFLAGLAVAAVSTWHVQAWRYDAQIAGIKTAHAQAATLASEEAARNFRAITTQYEGALNDARKREADLRRNVAAARTESDGLRDAIYAFRAKLPNASAATVAVAADTAAELLGACVNEYQDVAAAADGHAADARTLVEAWPVTGAADARHQD